MTNVVKIWEEILDLVYFYLWGGGKKWLKSSNSECYLMWPWYLEERISSWLDRFAGKAAEFLNSGYLWLHTRRRHVPTVSREEVVSPEQLSFHHFNRLASLAKNDDKKSFWRAISIISLSKHCLDQWREMLLSVPLRFYPLTLPRAYSEPFLAFSSEEFALETLSAWSPLKEEECLSICLKQKAA